MNLIALNLILRNHNLSRELISATTGFSSFLVISAFFKVTLMVAADVGKSISHSLSVFPRWFSDPNKLLSGDKRTSLTCRVTLYPNDSATHCPFWFMFLSYNAAFCVADQPVWISVCASGQDGGQEGVLWLAAARHQTLQTHTDECHQEMELDVQGAFAQPCKPEVRHSHSHTSTCTVIRLFLCHSQLAE